MKTAIWFDATTVAKYQRHSPVGLSRVEANVLGGAMNLPEATVRFCAFDRYAGEIQEIAREAVSQLLDEYGSSVEPLGHGAARKRKSWLARLGRELEKKIRVAVRSSVAQLRKNVSKRAGIDWQAGDILVISGASWDSVDADVLRRLVDERGVRLVAVMADMIPIIFPHHFQERQTVDGFSRYAEVCASHAELVLHISQSTKDDFEHFARQRSLCPKRSEVITLGASEATADQKRPQALPTWIGEGQFVSSVSTIQVRKNHQLLYQLWRRFAEERQVSVPPLVLVGSPGWLSDDLRFQIQHDPLVQDRIFVLNQVDDAQLAWIYANSRFTLYPSFYEGWGLPIVESLQFGRPCIASQTSSMPEASQGLAVHLDPLDFRAWYETVYQWSVDDSIIREQEQAIAGHFQLRPWSDFSREFCQRVWDLDQPDYPEKEYLAVSDLRQPLEQCRQDNRAAA